MMWLRRFRSVVVLAGCWSLGWLLYSIPATLLLYWELRTINPTVPFSLLELLAEHGPAFARGGAGIGALFALLLWLGERRRSAATLTLPRAALWGALAATSYILLWFAAEQGFAGTSLTPYLVRSLLETVLGSMLAGAAVVGLARRAASPASARGGVAGVAPFARRPELASASAWPIDVTPPLRRPAERRACGDREAAG